MRRQSFFGKKRTGERGALGGRENKTEGRVGVSSEQEGEKEGMNNGRH